MAEQQFCLRWNNFQSNIVSSFEALLDNEEFVDVTLTAEGKSMKAHRVLLSACSPYFSELFRDLPDHQHPVIVLRDTGFSELKALLSFIYHGEVNVSQDRLGPLLKTAEVLRIKGLAQENRRDLEQFGSIFSSPEKVDDDFLEKIDRRTPRSDSPSSNFGFNLSSLPTGNMVPLEPPSHKSSVIQPSSPPPKRRKAMHSPHARPPRQLTPGHSLSCQTPPGHSLSGHTPPGHSLSSHTPPGHTPPGQILLGHTPPGQMPLGHTPVHTPPGQTPPSSGGPPSLRELSLPLQATPPHHFPQYKQQITPTSSSSVHSSEDDTKVVNLTIGNNGTLSGSMNSPPQLISKIEVKEEKSLIISGGGGMDSKQEGGEDPPLPPPPLHPHDEDSRDNDTINSSHLPAQNYVPYASSPMETYAGPSGVPPSQNQAGWGTGTGTGTGATSTHVEPSESNQGSHPVFNELFCEGGGSIGGKKAVPTPCPVCFKVLSNAYNMRVHLETHQDITYKCIICGIITRTRDTMRKHLSNVHKLRNVELKNSFKRITGKSSSSTQSSSSSSSSGNLVATNVPTTTTMTAPVTPTKSSNAGARSCSFASSGLGSSAKGEASWTVPSSWDDPESLSSPKGSSLASIVSKLSQKQ